jgi:hypothetical protein
VDQNGERIEYSKANAARLYAYIQQMEVALGITTPTIGPARFLF